MHDIFISYSSKNQNVADAIVNILENKKIKCWIAYRDADVGEDYAGSIVRAIKNCKASVLVFSSESNQSKHVLNEINSSVNYGKVIIPFRIDNVMMHDAMEYYLGRTHWLDALTQPLEDHINKLMNRLNVILHNENIQEQKPIETPASETRMAKYAEMVKIGYNIKKISIQLVENYYINCNGHVEDNAGTPEQWAEFFQNSTESIRYLLNTKNEIVGGWSIIALKKEVYDIAKEGKLLEKDINYEMSEILAFPDFYYGYFIGFSILPDYRNMDNYMMLMTSFYQQLEEYAEKGIIFKELCINIISPQIENVMRKLDFVHIANNISYGKIYHQECLPLPNNSITNNYSKLKNIYTKAYKQIKVNAT